MTILQQYSTLVTRLACVVSRSRPDPGTDVDQGSVTAGLSQPEICGPVFQQYSSEFEEWLDLEDDTVIDNKTKVTVILEVNSFVS